MGDVDEVTALLVEAFMDYPPYLYILPGARRADMPDACLQHVVVRKSGGRPLRSVAA